MLRLIPSSSNPDLLVGIENSDDAGVFRVSDDLALVQTVDFFTPIVDDPYAYGQIAAANSLSDVYAMGGSPITVLNLACFDPTLAPADVWAQIILGMRDKTLESGAVIAGGHTIEDPQPKFGLAVTGVVNPKRMFVNTNATPCDHIYLSKPLGTGIVTTAAKFDACAGSALAAATASMATLNKGAMEAGQLAGVRCATDITGFGLAGHLMNIARGSGVAIHLDARSLPLLPDVRELAEAGNLTAGGSRNRAYVGDAYHSDNVPDWLEHVLFDPQTSGGLALFSKEPIPGMPCIGRVAAGEPSLHVK